MKCEICHEADAAAVIHMKKDGETRELYVCKACAAKSKHPAAKKEVSGRERRQIHIEEDGEPPEFVKNLVEATLGFMKGVAESEHDTHTKCPACKMTWEEAKKSGRLGCPACWKAFARDIRETFLSVEYGPTHVGAMPPTVTGEDSRSYLERQLKAAVSREDFKKAAALKRQIDSLGKNEES